MPPAAWQARPNSSAWRAASSVPFTARKDLLAEPGSISGRADGIASSVPSAIASIGLVLRAQQIGTACRFRLHAGEMPVDPVLGKPPISAGTIAGTGVLADVVIGMGDKRQHAHGNSQKTCQTDVGTDDPTAMATGTRCSYQPVFSECLAGLPARSWRKCSTRSR